MKRLLFIPGIILLFTCRACKEKEAFRIPTEPERNYLMSHSTVTFKPELAALIDSFIHLHPDLEYNNKSFGVFCPNSQDMYKGTLRLVSMPVLKRL